MDPRDFRAVTLAAVVLALGLCGAAFIFGAHVSHIGTGRQSISVKGLAERPVQADRAEWTVNTEVRGASFAEALKTLRAAQPKLRAFLVGAGFDGAAIKDSQETVRPHMVEQEGREGRTRYVQDGFEASQSLTVSTQDLAKIQAASKAILQFEAEGNPRAPSTSFRRGPAWRSTTTAAATTRPPSTSSRAWW
jgi:hypothetical protein